MICSYSANAVSTSRVEDRLSVDKTTLEQKTTDEFSLDLKAHAQKQPLLILIGGFQGSGKSSLITRMKKIYDVNVISTDAIRQNLFNKGVKVSPEFSKSINNIYTNLVKKSLSNHSHIVIDANAHSKRIEEIEKLVEESKSPYSIIKIFLKASDNTLRNRVKTRPTLAGFYQGTMSDLEAALTSLKIQPEEYTWIVETDTMNESEVFASVNDFIFPYFSLQKPL